MNKLALSLAVALALAAPAAAGNVRIVRPTGSQTFADVGSALAASVDGDVLLVAAGTYPGFSVPADRSIAILATPSSADVIVQGTISLQPQAQKSVLLAGLTVRAPAGYGALNVLLCAGSVRAQDCEFFGGQQRGIFGGSSGIWIQGCPNAVFLGCRATGGTGLFSSTQGYPGPAAAYLGSGSRVAFHSCEIYGGTGGPSDDYGGEGGAGIQAVAGSQVFVGDSTVTGGAGGNASPTGFYFGGAGGAGIALSSGAIARVLDSSLVGGHGGQWAGPSGPPSSGPGFTFLAGDAPRLSVEPFADDESQATLTLEGVPGDQVSALIGLAPEHAFAAQSNGIVEVALPGRRTVALGIVPASGSFSAPIPAALLPPSQQTAPRYVQCVFQRAAGGTFLSGSSALVVLNRDIGPDCDGNSVQDFVDVAVEPVRDCNGNLFPDACDIANGTSTDLDGNGIPDECGFSWYVDDSAPPGGNGLQAAPFQTLSQGLAAAQNGHLVIVLDGTYTGPANRGLSFGGRNIVLQSANGPANCVIDCQGAGRAFQLSQLETSAARIAGFTIRNGFAANGGAIQLDRSHPTISDCLILDCASSLDGGAIYSLDSGALVTGCTIAGCVAGGTGGGAWATGSAWGTPRFLSCTFAGNSAGTAGALYGSVVRASHCTFVGNAATAASGAAGGAFSGGSFVLGNSLFAGNVSAGDGGAVGLVGGAGKIQDCTFVDNTAATSGGALALQVGFLPLVCANNVVYGNSAPSGAQIRVNTWANASVAISYCDVQGGQAGIPVQGGGLLWGAGNLALAPQFADPDGPDDDPLTLGDNDYRLASTSPCIDAGSNALVAADELDLDGDGNTSEPSPVDVEGAARFVDVPSVPDTGAGTPPLVDLGCYERP